ncbi:zinc finger domain-containing protein [Streptomyces sp. NBC_00670]|uniref:zinc finger domain-containing protein n=1 Tax=Streptomyces sp. NBC_00670 TaxID=2975804 RepID=UPI002E33D173|nr:hypothetical protein [Streptomyces sp. NBC_00670]
MTSRAYRRQPELEHACAWCHAQADEPCTTLRRPRPTSHPGRVEVWVVASTDCPACHAPAGTPCAIPDSVGRMVPGADPDRVQAAHTAHAEALEAASRDIPGGRP